MTHGAIIWVNLEDVHPPEFGKTRPAIIVSNTVQNQTLDTVVVVPLSTQPPNLWPLRIQLETKSLGRQSFAVVPGIRQVDKSRLLEVAGHVSDGWMRNLAEAINAYLS